MELTRLKANSQYRPCVDEKPYFSWVLTSEKKNVRQSSYHITVTDPEEVVWDSGIVDSDKSIFVEYAGPPLKSLCEYRWTVTVTDIQSRGVCNRNTEYHDSIVKLVNNNMNLIRKCLKKVA